ncbi:MAG: hypothetical protein IJ133_04800 [Clostridia bacterium]|nr:hypothetical protein [Clostridia bacterium]
MKSTRKAISLILAFVFLISCTVAATAINAANYKDSNGQRPADVVIRMFNDGLREAAETNGYSSETLSNYLNVTELRSVLENQTMTLTDYFNSLSEFDKGKFIALCFLLESGGPPMEYAGLFEEYVYEQRQLYAEMLLLLIKCDDPDFDQFTEEELVAMWESAKDSFTPMFDRTMDFKEYLSRLIAYFGNNQKLDNYPTCINGSGFGSNVVGMDFYEVIDYLYGFSDGNGGYTRQQDTLSILMKSFSCSTTDYVTFLLAVYDYMYPEITPTTTTTTTKIVTTITNRFRDMTNIARATNVTNVSATNVSLPY